MPFVDINGTPTEPKWPHFINSLPSGLGTGSAPSIMSGGRSSWNGKMASGMFLVRQSVGHLQPHLHPLLLNEIPFLRLHPPHPPDNDCRLQGWRYPFENNLPVRESSVLL